MSRLNIVFAAFTAVFVIIIGRLFFIQNLSGDAYASNDYLQTVRIQPIRGEITDRNGEPLVLNETRYVLFAEPEYIEDVDDVIDNIDEILKIDEATLEAKFDTDKKWIPVSRDVAYEQKESIDELDLAGLGFDETSRRFYPEASLTAHLVGFVGKDQDGDNIGYFGVEGYYNKDLEGLPGILKTERDVLGRPIVIGTQDKLKGENGRTLALTIDNAVQRTAKEKLHNAIQRYEAQSGCVTVADPHTMEIRAMTCLPDFDPLNYFEFTENEYKNPVVTNVFEPGSIFKPLVVAAALEEEAIEPDDTYDEEGPIKIGQYYIRTWNDEYNGNLSIAEILQNSSNVGMVHIGNQLGNEKLREYITKYGFGELTHIDVQGEIPSFVKPEKNWYPIDYATATFGQGIAVTQIQMIRAFASLINGGWIMQPHVVKQMTSENGEVYTVDAKKQTRVLTEKTSNQIKKMLQSTVENGEANWDIPDGYTFGGKTGTAQIAFEGTYDPSKTNASFIGFAPVNEPEFIMLVTLHQPAASPWASETAAPLFFDIAKDIIVEYNIAPD